MRRKYIKIKILLILLLIAVGIFLVAAGLARPPAQQEFSGTFVYLDVISSGYIYQT